ncbi:ABC transporter substrate-binding protein [Microlunatus soli]|uniref:Polar amino acid transport system substrate-binding protein n=1 Tax=Microlunatus soli TaxID=630515 RepID=A0A1H1MH88_9ACTN|nr:ABC transporter substrate-binding protein [Microlunatus soli]SDR85745.1 polar amino acid transport system substrate-binding protein [Microlunatus soli]
MKPKYLIGGIVAAALALTSTACSNSLSGDNGDQASSAPSVQADQKLFERLPDDIKKDKTILVGTDASYAPNEFTVGNEIQGFDIDVFNAIAAKLGVKAEYQNAKFDTIIPSVSSGKFDAGISSFTVNATREKQVNMTSYFTAGTQWAVAEGNPKKIDPDNACGKTVAVQTGTTQELDDLPVRQKKCGANKIKVLHFDGQDTVTTTVVSGRADAMLADSPVAQYAAKQQKGKIQTVGDVYATAPYGIITAKDQTEYAQVIADAFAEVQKEGAVKSAMAKWGITTGEIDNPTVNPSVS